MKINVAVMFGGKSVEHEISVISALQAAEYLDREKYEVIPGYITKQGQMYTGEADWTLIGEVKNNPRMHIPIIGNGDVTTPQRAKECFDRYGVDAVMIGRASFGRPWIFKEVKHFMATGEVMPQPSVVERVAIAKEHLAKSLEIKGDRVGILEMRRHLSNYFKGLPNFKDTRMKLVTENDPAELFATIDSIEERWGDFDTAGCVPPPLSHDI